MIQRLLVLAKALPTYLALASVVVTVLLQELVPLLPEGLAVRVAAVAAGVIAVIAAVIKVVQRLTPADPATFGLLPGSAAELPSVPANHVDRGQVTAYGILTVVVVVLAVLFVVLLIAGRINI